MPVKVALANRQPREIDARRLKEAVRSVLEAEGFAKGEVSVAVVDNGLIHELNQRYLQHDYPTDVLTFVFKRGPKSVEGEIVVSAEYAEQEAPEYGWPAADELLLYVIHGALHLAGYDDKDPTDEQEMRAQERAHLRRLGVEVKGPD